MLFTDPDHWKVQIIIVAYLSNQYVCFNLEHLRSLEKVLAVFRKYSQYKRNNNNIVYKFQSYQFSKATRDIVCCLLELSVTYLWLCPCANATTNDVKRQLTFYYIKTSESLFNNRNLLSIFRPQISIFVTNLNIPWKAGPLPRIALLSERSDNQHPVQPEQR